MLVFLQFSVVILLVILAYIYIFKKSKKQDYFKGIGGPKGWLLIGNAWEFKTSEDTIPVLMRYIKEHGRIFKTTFGPFRNYFVTDHKLLEYIFNSNQFIDKSIDYKFLHAWLGTGLLTSTGQKWKSHRKLITPTFHFKILEQFIDSFESAGNIMISKWKKLEDKSSIDVFPYISLCALDIICESAMGVKINAQINEKSEYVQHIKSLLRIVSSRSTSILGNFEFLFQLTSDSRSEKKSVKYLHDVTYSVIDKRKELLKNRVEEKNNESDIGIKRKKAFLDLLLETNLTREEIREEVDTFIFEGHDTTAAAMSFALHCLAENPDVQKKAYEEQQALFADEKNPKITYTDLQNMKYLEKVIKETLRLYPSVPMIGRQAFEDLAIDGKVIPKGTIIGIFIYGTMRDPEYFPDPEKFDPERFEGSNEGKSPFSYIPFSAGPRNCIGQKFAMLEMKSTISLVLRNFEIVRSIPEHKLRLSSEGVLCSKNGIKVGLKSRN